MCSGFFVNCKIPFYFQPTELGLEDKQVAVEPTQEVLQEDSEVGEEQIVEEF